LNLPHYLQLLFGSENSGLLPLAQNERGGNPLTSLSNRETNEGVLDQIFQLTYFYVINIYEIKMKK
jgi:hypothetical protein